MQAVIIFSTGFVGSILPLCAEKILFDHSIHIDVNNINVVQGTLPISTADFSMDELDTTAKSLSLEKAYLYLPVEVWRNGALNNELLVICNELLRGGTAPDKWKQSFIYPIPPKR